jgi:ubiquinone/menaquinone biosynthesis C-methylase UbiE
MDWRSFWDGDHPIYVNGRHRLLHDRRLADDIIALIPSPDCTVLDYACGEATEAERVAAHCGRLILSDGAPSVREKLKTRLAGVASIDVQSPEETADLPDHVLDLVIVNSLLQYLSREETAALLRLMARKLKPSGRLVIGDVIAPDTSPLTDALALLRFGAEGGFFWAALGGLVRTALGDYRKVRGALGLTMWTPDEMLALLREAGFEARRLPVNFGHNQARMAFEGRKP